MNPVPNADPNHPARGMRSLPAALQRSVAAFLHVPDLASLGAAAAGLRACTLADHLPAWQCLSAATFSVASPTTRAWAAASGEDRVEMLGAAVRTKGSALLVVELSGFGPRGDGACASSSLRSFAAALAACCPGLLVLGLDAWPVTDDDVSAILGLLTDRATGTANAWFPATM